MAPERIPLVVRTGLDVFCGVSIYSGPPEVPPQKLDCLLLSVVSCYFTVVFGFENGGDYWLGNVEASLVVEYVV